MYREWKIWLWRDCQRRKLSRDSFWWSVRNYGVNLSNDEMKHDIKWWKHLHGV